MLVEFSWLAFVNLNGFVQIYVNLEETVIKLHYMLRPWSDKGTLSSSMSSVNYVLLIY